jgi:hypothetical protein
MRFLYTEVVVQQLTQPFIRTKNDIGNDGTLLKIQYLAVTSWNISCLLNPGLYGSQYRRLVSRTKPDKKNQLWARYGGDAKFFFENFLYYYYSAHLDPQFPYFKFIC